MNWQGFKHFDRERLRSIHLWKLEGEDIFCICTKILDPQTLSVTVLKSYWTKKSLDIVVAMYLAEFHG